MGEHHKSNREVRKRKYAEQFKRTAENKRKRIARENAKQKKG